MHAARRLAALSIVAFSGLALWPAAHAAQSLASAVSAEQASDDAELNKTKASNLRALSKRVTLDVKEQPVSDVFEFIARVTGADLEPIFLDDEGFEGIDPETPITIRATDMPALSLLERVLARAQQIERPTSNYTWQFTDIGSIEFGPKSVLNRDQVVELYDIADLMYIVPRFEDAPEFDLSSALQSSQGGGGGTSPFQNSGSQDPDEPLEDRVQKLIDLIETTIEPEQWVSSGGEGASVTMFGNSLVITAPDYIHRQIAGYSFWPARLQQVRTVDGRRQMHIRPDSPARPKP